jgi:hypothetical protein
MWRLFMRGRIELVDMEPNPYQSPNPRQTPPSVRPTRLFKWAVLILIGCGMLWGIREMTADWGHIAEESKASVIALSIIIVAELATGFGLLCWLRWPNRRPPA